MIFVRGDKLIFKLSLFRNSLTFYVRTLRKLLKSLGTNLDDLHQKKKILCVLFQNFQATLLI